MCDKKFNQAAEAFGIITVSGQTLMVCANCYPNVRPQFYYCQKCKQLICEAHVDNHEPNDEVTLYHVKQYHKDLDACQTCYDIIVEQVKERKRQNELRKAQSVKQGANNYFEYTAEWNPQLQRYNYKPTWAKPFGIGILQAIPNEEPRLENKQALNEADLCRCGHPLRDHRLRFKYFLHGDNTIPHYFDYWTSCQHGIGSPDNCMCEKAIRAFDSYEIPYRSEYNNEQMRYIVQQYGATVCDE